MIRKAKNTNPSSVVAVAGCYSQLKPEEALKIGADIVVGTGKKLTVARLAKEYLDGKGGRGVDENSLVCGEFEKMTALSQERARAFIKIEDGCDSRCAYCIISTARGRVRSKSVEDVISEARAIGNNGYEEIVLTGVETSAFGKDSGDSLIGLLEKLESVKEVRRIRLGSLDPFYLKKDVIDRLSLLSKPMPHYHLSLQSGCDSTLARMRRKYNSGQALERIAYMRQKIKNVTFGADFIVGFPGETEDDFYTSVGFVNKAEILNSHVFAYSERKGTPAAGFENKVDEHEKKVRSAIFRKNCAEVKKSVINGFIAKGEKIGALLETYKDGYAFGHTDNFIEIKVKTDKFERPFLTELLLKDYDEKEQLTEGVSI